MSFSKNALFIMEKLYFRKDKNGKLLEKSCEETFNRVAEFAASGEKDTEVKKKIKNILFDLMMEQKFMFSSPTIFNAGSDFPLSSSCFVGGLKDDMLSIMKAATDTAITFKAGAGMGLNFGVLRPKGSPVGKGGTSSGPVSFMRLFDQVGETVKSGGVRRAAFMAMMDINHPDIEEFITSKDFLSSLRLKYPSLNLTDDFLENLLENIFASLYSIINDESIIQQIYFEIRKNLFESLSNMNISVAITDEFMKTVKSEMEFNLDSFPFMQRRVNARELFHKIAISAWRTADPGVWFIDRANEFDTVPSLGKILSTNPCGEQSLHNYTSCNLGSINLNKFVINNHFDFKAFKETICYAVRGLDNIIDVAAFPTEEFRVNTLKIRPVGLGFTGLAEVMFKLRIPYNSEEGFKFGAEIAKCLTQSAIESSIEIAKEKGSFELFEENKKALIKVVQSYYDSEEEKEDIKKKILKYGIRNSNWTTLAPTGTISLILDAYTYSLEPQFALAYNKNLIDGGKLKYIDPEFEKAVNHDKNIIDKVIKNGGSCQNIGEISDEIKRVFVVAHDIHYEDRIKMQAALQKYISNSISSTINLPATTTVEEIENIYLKAWESGLKGITIYRDGAKYFQPMTTLKEKKRKTKTTEAICKKYVRPKVIKGEIFKTKTGSGTLYTSLGLDENGWPVEIFINISKHGSDVSAFSEALGRVISIALQSGVPVDKIAETIIGITGDSSAWDNGKLIKSIPDAVGRILKEYAERLNIASQQPDLFKKEIINNNHNQGITNSEIKGASICPNCGEKSLIKSEDCNNCLSCGYSKCG